ncbi:cell division protein FtsQ [Bacteroidales bacterium]|nr:cell division protein FtsQ [Bacteroidales bacterium]
MIKKITLITLILLILAYILYSVFIINPRVENVICNDFHINIIDTLERQAIKSKDIALILKKERLTPLGKLMKEIDTKKIERKILENESIKSVSCYKTTSGKIKIDVYQKIPILRIISNEGDFYIDEEGREMPSVGSYACFVPVATGYVKKDFAKKQLYNFALFLKKNKFWSAQIEQIYVHPNQDIEISPRIGNHQIMIGKIENVEGKLEKLKLFYEKGLSEVGWNNYSLINLKYKDQVVCTKRTEIIDNLSQ